MQIFFLGKVKNSKIIEQLLLLMNGGRRPSDVCESQAQSCDQIWEGEMINTDVTAAGATMALALMFLKTGNSTVISWLQPPDTVSLLDEIRPDLLMLRVLAKALVEWDKVEPTK